MEVCVLILALCALVSADFKVLHEDISMMFCSDTEKEFIFGGDGEEMFHSDFRANKGEITLPYFSDPINFPGFYENSLVNIAVCKQNLAVSIQAYKSPVEKMDPPQTSIYSRDVLLPDVGNKLICHVTGFFPPPVRVYWTKNNVNVMEGMSLSEYRPNNDGTFNIFSTLSIVPEEGDIYSCSVNHKTLEQDQTKTWEVEFSAVGVGASVFCGVCVSLGLLGIAAGTFLLIKVLNCN